MADWGWGCMCIQLVSVPAGRLGASCGAEARCRCGRYGPGQRFGKHVDDSVDLGNSISTQYTVLIYLTGSGLPADSKTRSKPAAAGKDSIALVGGQTIFYGMLLRVRLVVDQISTSIFSKLRFVISSSIYTSTIQFSTLHQHSAPFLLATGGCLVTGGCVTACGSSPLLEKDAMTSKQSAHMCVPLGFQHHKATIHLSQRVHVTQKTALLWYQSCQRPCRHWGYVLQGPEAR